jgi:hypothetical protein
MKQALGLGWLLLSVSALACGQEPEGAPPPDAAAPPDTRAPAPDTAAAPSPAPGPTTSPDAAPPVASPDAASPAPDAAPTSPDGAPSGDAAPSAPATEAMWALTGCNQAMLMYPMIDRNMGRFPPGSCPPPETLRRDCGAGSKIAVMTATASSFETGFVHPPNYAVDEHLMTRWSSPATPATAWLALDLGVEKTFKRIYLAWEAAFATGYDVQTSPDGQAWTTIREVRGSNGYQDILDVEANSRHLRINGIMKGSQYGYSLFDVTICGERP